MNSGQYITACSLLLAFLSHPLGATGLHFRLDASTEFRSDADGQLHALQMRYVADKKISAVWLEDKDLSAAAREQLLVELSQTLQFDMLEFNFFAEFWIAGEAVEFAEVIEHSVALSDQQQVIMDFQIPLAQPRDIAASNLMLILSDPYGSGMMVYATADEIKLDERLAKICQPAQMTSETVELNTHEVEIQTVKIDCSSPP